MFHLKRGNAKQVMCNTVMYRDVCGTLDHSLALCLVLTALLSSAYSAPMNEPIEVPPTMSIGIPASSIALITPTCEQPLQGGKQTFFQQRPDKLLLHMI